MTKSAQVTSSHGWQPLQSSFSGACVVCGADGRAQYTTTAYGATEPTQSLESSGGHTAADGKGGIGRNQAFVRGDVAIGMDVVIESKSCLGGLFVCMAVTKWLR